ncbi:glutaredoxin [Microbotryomycetes sp. JL221]|nr:glutaredoxin [Microbotryomycetes sp. JL221]
MATPTNLHKVDSPEHLQQLLSQDLTRVSVLYFRADWAQPCQQMDTVNIELAKRWSNVLFLSIEAEALPDISESFEVDAVPYFILLRGHTLLTRLSGAQPTALSQALTAHASRQTPTSTTNLQPKAPSNATYSPAQDDNSATTTRTSQHQNSAPDNETEQELDQRCHKIMNQSDVVLFMKGDASTPRCGFSQKIVGLLQNEGIEFTTFDILSDESVRQRLKILNDWPTFPQLIIKGEFVGGLDVVKEMQENGELKELVNGP